MAFIKFPGDFTWGASTSAYQIEGAFNEEGKGLSTWDEFSHSPGNINDGTTGDIACDHYHKYKEDIELIHNLGVQAYRFSLSWPRILPAGSGKVNKQGLDFYDRLIDLLLDRGVTPFITLFHWDLPLALHSKGGWTTRDTTEYFADYCGIAAEHYGDRVRHWITLNEPVYGIGNCGYLLGIHAPGIADYRISLKAKYMLALAHGRGFRRLKEIDAGFKVGIAEAVFPLYPLKPEYEDLKELLESHRFRFILDPVIKGQFPPLINDHVRAELDDIRDEELAIIHTPLDFVGLHNYTRFFYEPDSTVPSGFKEILIPAGYESSYTDMGWEIFPEGMYHTVMDFRRLYGDIPIYITENGAAFNDELADGKVADRRRVAFIRDYLSQLARAMAEGCNVKGYFVWSLMDNFEWAEGYSKRFGIIYVDYKTLKRYPKESYYWYRNVCREQGFRVEE